MPTRKPPRSRKNPLSARKESQGLLLFEKSANRFQAFDETSLLLKKLNSLFERKGYLLTASTSGDKIYYFNQFLENAINVLEK